MKLVRGLIITHRRAKCDVFRYEFAMKSHHQTNRNSLSFRFICPCYQQDQGQGARPRTWARTALSRHLCRFGCWGNSAHFFSTFFICFERSLPIGQPTLNELPRLEFGQQQLGSPLNIHTALRRSAAIITASVEIRLLGKLRRFLNLTLFHQR